MAIGLWPALFAMLAAGAQEQLPPGKGVNFYSREKEAALGASLAAEVRRNSTIVDAPEASEYLGRLAARLSADTSFSFEITADRYGGSTLEPLALPGGYIFVPAELFLKASDEAEFAGMVAHAMAHVIARHGTRAATRGQIVSQASMPLIFMGGWNPGTRGDGNLLVPLGMLQFQRGYEFEADRLAVRMMSGTGWDPTALAAFIERTQVDTATPARSALPARDTRLAGLRQAISELPARSYTAGGEFTAVQEQIRALLPAHRPPSLRR